MRIASFGDGAKFHAQFSRKNMDSLYEKQISCPYREGKLPVQPLVLNTGAVKEQYLL